MDNSNYDDTFQTAAAQNGVDPIWLKAQAMAESSLDPTAVNDKTKATGISQIIPATAQSLGVDPTDPVSSINGQARLMAENLKRYGNIQDATRAYHGGTDEDNWGPKTEAYVKKVSANYQQLKQSGAMTDPADAYLETDSAGPPKADPDVESFLSAEPTMGAATSSPPEVPSAGGPTSQPTQEKVAISKKYDPVQVAGNMMNAIPAGITSGAANMLMEGGKGAAYLGNKLGLVPDSTYANVKNKIGDFQNLVKGDVSQMDPVTQGAYTTGQVMPAVAATSGLAAPFSKGIQAVGDSGIASKVAQLALSGTGAATQGAAVNALNPTASDQDFGDRTKQGAEIAGALGVAAPAAKMVGAGAFNALTGGADPEAAALAQKLQDNYGIKIPAYQLSNSPMVQKIGSFLQRVGLAGTDASGPQAMAAIGNAIGAPGTVSGLTPEVMQAAKDATGAGYDKVLDNIGNVKVGDLDTKLANILDDAESSLDANQMAPLRNLANKMLNNVKDGDVIPAQIYKDMIKKGSILDKATSSPTIGQHAQDIESALQDSMRASASPEDVKTLQDLDMKWKNMRTVEGLAAKSDASGQFPIQNLTSPVVKSFKNSAYTGAGALGDIAKGARTFKLSPSSGTAENHFLGNLVTGGGLLSAGGAFIDPALAAKAAVLQGATLAGGRAVGGALTSDVYRNMLMNSIYGDGGAYANSAINSPMINATSVLGNQAIGNAGNKMFAPSSSK